MDQINNSLQFTGISFEVLSIKSALNGLYDTTDVWNFQHMTVKHCLFKATDTKTKNQFLTAKANNKHYAHVNVGFDN